jgi:hypothetical protein
LLVEEPCTYPARLTADGLSLRPAPAEGGRGVVADAIGEGTLGDFDGIALLLDDEPTAS